MFSETWNKARIIAVLFCLTFQPSAAQIEFADAMYESGQYKLALMEYNRSAFLYDIEPSAHVNYRMAECYQLTENHSLAIAYFERAYNASDNDSMRFESLLAKVKVYFDQKDYKSVLFELLGNPLQQNRLYHDRIRFYTGAAYIFTGNGPEAYKALKPIVTDTVTLAKLLLKNKLQKPRIVSMVALSAVLPGLGQAFMGDWKSGINSLLINSVFLGMYMNVSANLGVADALLSTFPWFQRYYQGGLEATVSLALEKQMENRYLIFHKISLMIYPET